MWDANNGKLINTLRGHNGPILCLASSVDGKSIATGGADNTIILWDVEMGRQRLSLSGHSGAVLAIAFSQDGQRLVSGSKDETVRLWGTQSGKAMMTFTGHGGEIRTVAFNRNGKRILSGSTDKKIRIWEVDTGQNTLTLVDHMGSLTAVAFSPDDKRLASANTQMVKLWDSKTGQELITFRPNLPWLDKVTSMAFSPDGKTIAFGVSDGTVRLWGSFPPAGGYMAIGNMVIAARDVAYRGETLAELGQLDKALADFSEAIRLNPNFAMAYKYRGDVYRRQNQFDLALEDYSKALELGPNDPTIKHNVALVFLNSPHAQLRDTAHALELAKQVVDAKPEGGYLWSVLGQARYRIEDYQDAVEALQKSIELDYARKARSWFFLAMAHWKLGNQDEARQFYDQAVSWMQENQPANASFPQSQFREEAAELMGIEPDKEDAEDATADTETES